MPRDKLQTLTEPMYYVLLSLRKPQCGIEIMDEVKRISKNRVLIGPGTLYTMLAKFEENDIIEPIEMLVNNDSTSKTKRKYYSITNHGKEMLRKEFEHLYRMSEDGKQIMEELK